MSSIGKFNIVKFGSVDLVTEGILVLSKFTKFESNGSGTRIFYNVYEDNSVVQVDVTDSYSSVSSLYAGRTVDVGLPLYSLTDNSLVNVDTGNIYRIVPSSNGVNSILMYYDQNNMTQRVMVKETLDEIITLANSFDFREVLSVNGILPDNTGNVSLGGENYFPVMAVGTPTENAAALFNVYNTAVTSTPNGTAKSASNRAVVVLSPGIYDLGVVSFILGTEFVDLVGLTGNPNDVLITSANIVGDGTILKTSDDNVISGITVELTSVADDDRACIYTPDLTGFSAEVWTNVVLRGVGNPTNVKGVFSGVYTSVKSSGPLFGSLAASECLGKFVSCEGGDNSFAAAGNIGATANLYFNIAGADSYATDGGSVDVAASLQYNVLNRGKATDQP